MSGWNVGTKMHTIIRGDCLPVMREIADSSVDLVLTDPPYGWGFMGKSWDKALPDPQVWREAFRVLKPGGSALVMSGSRLDCLWRMCRDLEAAGFELSQTALYWVYRSGFPKGGDLSKMADARAGAEREVTRTWTGGMRTGCIANSVETNLGTQTKPMYDNPVSPLARELDGWFTKGKVKPAVEVIIWARKPISEKTELDNMTKWGVGGVNCGACMVPSDEPITVNVLEQWSGLGQLKQPSYVSTQQTGRFPANMLVTNNALGDGSRYFDVDKWADEHGITEDGWADAAAAGVLQIAKPSRGEKNAGCEGLEKHTATVTMGLVKQCANCGGKAINSRGLACGCDKPTPILVKQAEKPRANHHPTCKPVTLMAYLISFFTKPGATVLDCFCGSGTTGVACAQTGREFIGIELDADDQGYIAIAEARIAHAEALAAEKQAAAQLSLLERGA